MLTVIDMSIEFVGNLVDGVEQEVDSRRYNVASCKSTISSGALCGGPVQSKPIPISRYQPLSRRSRRACPVDPPCILLSMWRSA